MDFSQYDHISDEKLAQVARVSLKPKTGDEMSDDELAAIAGVKLEPNDPYAGLAEQATAGIDNIQPNPYSALANEASYGINQTPQLAPLDMAQTVGVGILDGMAKVGSATRALNALNPAQIVSDGILRGMGIKPQDPQEQFQRLFADFAPRSNAVYDVSRGVGEGLLLPGGIAKTALGSIAAGAGIGGVYGIGKQVSENKFDPASLALEAAGGGLGGGIAHGVVKGAGALIQSLSPKRVNLDDELLQQTDNQATEALQDAIAALTSRANAAKRIAEIDGDPHAVPTLEELVRTMLPQDQAILRGLDLDQVLKVGMAQAPKATPQPQVTGLQAQIKNGLIDMDDDARLLMAAQSQREPLQGSVSVSVKQQPKQSKPQTSFEPDELDDTDTTTQLRALANDLRTLAERPKQGETRYQLPRDENMKEMLGRARVGQAVHIDQIPVHILNDTQKESVRKLAQAKLYLEMSKQHLDAFVDALDRQGKNNVVADGQGYRIQPPSYKTEITREGEKAKASLRADLTELLLSPEGGGPRAMVDDQAVKEILARAPQPTGIDSYDLAKIEHLKNAVKLWDGRRKDAVSELKKGKKDILLEAQRKLQTLDPHATLQIAVPVGESTVLVESAQASIKKAFVIDEWEKASKGLKPEEIATRMRTYFEDAARTLGRSPEDWRRVYEDSVANRKAYELGILEIAQQHTKQTKVPAKAVKMSQAAIRGALGFTGGVSLLSDQPAEAYTNKEGHKRGALGVGTVIGVPLLVAAATGKFSLPAVRKLVKEGFVASSKTLGDTLDHMQTIDSVVGTRMAADYIDHSKAIQQANMGIKLDGTDAATALEQLRLQVIDVRQALAGGKAFANLNQEQRNAVIQEHLNKRTMTKKIVKQIGQVEQWYRQLPEADKAKYSTEMLHLQAAQEALTNTSPHSPLARHVAAGMSHMFRLNPKFALLNLSDAIIAGGSRVGILRLAQAYHLLAFDPAVRALYKHSNLVGGIRAERNALQGMAQANPKNMGAKVMASIEKGLDKLPDFPTDQLNANVVHLASMLGSYQKAQHLGMKATKSEYLQAVLTVSPTKSITATHVDDAWIQAFDDTLRTLSVDPMRLNKNIITTNKYASYFAAFVNQPARIARLVNEYATNGEIGKMSTFLTAMVLLGGSAVIPRSVRVNWQALDPDNANAAFATLDDMTVWQMGGNALSKGRDEQGNLIDPEHEKLVRLLQPDLADKLEWEPFALGKIPSYAAFGTQHPSLEAIGSSLIDSADIITDVRSGKEENLIKARNKALTIAGMLGLLGNFPTGATARYLRAHDQSEKGKIPIWYFDQTGKSYGKKQTIDLENVPGGQFIPYALSVIPGKSSIEASSQRAKYEQSKRKKVEADQGRAMYQDLLMEFAGR